MSVITEEQPVTKAPPVQNVRDRVMDLKARALTDKAVSASQFAEGLDLLDELMGLLQQTNIDKFLTGEILIGVAGAGVGDGVSGESVDERLRRVADESLTANSNGNGNHDGGTHATQAADGGEEPKAGEPPSDRS